MSEYRRLISYIYEYEGKEKGKNVGFVKLEARNGQCRLNVNVKRMYVGGNAIGVYLLSKEGEHVLLGNMFVRNGGGEFRATVDAKNVEGSGIGLDGYYGLTVHDVKNAWRSYTTVWEDAAVPAPAAGTEQNVKQSAEYDSGTGPMAQDILPGSEAQPQVRVIPSVVQEIEEEIARSAELHASPEPVGVEERDTAHQLDDETDTAVESWQNADTEAEDHAVFLQVGQTESGRSAEHAPEIVGMQNNRLIPQENPSQPDEPVDAPMVSPELENPEVLRYLQETESVTADPEQLWRELRSAYPKIQPFDYDGGSEVLTIRPQDIGKLPRENWIYGNNSFLLHGYYNFRYLILIRLDNSNGKTRYLIGVPGHYYSNEKYMATMFGFPNFVLSKKQPPNDGRFGYWYTDIKMR